MINYKTLLATAAAITMMAGDGYADLHPPAGVLNPPGLPVPFPDKIVIDFPPGVYHDGDRLSFDEGLMKKLNERANLLCQLLGYDYGEADPLPHGDGASTLAFRINCYYEGGGW